MNIIEVLAKEFGLKQSQVEQTEATPYHSSLVTERKRPADFPTWCSVIWTNG